MSSREETEARLQALLADHLDNVGERHPEGFEIGVTAIVTEVRFPADAEWIELVVESRPRPEALYTPEAEFEHYVSFTSSDNRDWIKLGLLRSALMALESDSARAESDETEEES